MITIDQIQEIIVQNVPDIEIEDIKNDTSLREQDVDSLDMFNIIIELQELSGFEVPDEDIEKIRTVNSMHKYFNK